MTASKLPPRFLFIVDNKFNITGRGIVITGFLYRGSLKPKADLGTEIEIISPTNHKIQRTRIKGFETYCMSGQTVAPSPSLGILIEGLTKEDIEIGSIVIDKAYE
jgi:translation elongation factor EF-Tu-like GTPase